jgi:hypothetical protein
MPKSGDLLCCQTQGTFYVVKYSGPPHLRLLKIISSEHGFQLLRSLKSITSEQGFRHLRSLEGISSEHGFRLSVHKMAMLMPRIDKQNIWRRLLHCAHFRSTPPCHLHSHHNSTQVRLAASHGCCPVLFYSFLVKSPVAVKW